MKVNPAVHGKPIPLSLGGQARISPTTDDLVVWERKDCSGRFIVGGLFLAQPGKPADAVIPCGLSSPERALPMRRDMELVREILTIVRDRTTLAYEHVHLPGRDVVEVARHAEMLIGAGYLDGKVLTSVTPGVPVVVARDLTWEGHEFYGVLTSNGWDAIKKKFSAAELATVPLSVLKAVGAKALEHLMLSQMGL